MSEPKNVDATLVQVINQQTSGNEAPPQVLEEAPPIQAETPEPQAEPQVETPVEQSQQDVSQPEVKNEESPIDEYGNPIGKPKLYTEEELNSIIRERLQRGRHSEQPTPREVQQASEGFKADPNSEETWEVQLEKFVDNVLEKKQAKLAEQKWREEESRKQADFESRFTSQMNKYADFREVVSNKPITDSMMMAARGLDNPAAFIYGACKLYPQEVESIAKINDPYAQAAAVGRLHERMIKSKTITNAPRPLDVPKGDMPAKVNNSPSIESRINEYAKSKRK